MKMAGHFWKWGTWHPWAPASYTTGNVYLHWNSNLWYLSGSREVCLPSFCVPICCHSENSDGFWKSNQKQQILQTSLVQSQQLLKLTADNASTHRSVIWNELTFKFYFNQEIWYLAGFMPQCHPYAIATRDIWSTILLVENLTFANCDLQWCHNGIRLDTRVLHSVLICSWKISLAAACLT